LVNQQETTNKKKLSMTTQIDVLKKQVGSSETIRKTPLYTQVFTQPFHFVAVTKFIPQHIKPSTYSSEFLSWFIGFSEGDGSFIVSGSRLFFTITQQDVPLLRRLRTQLGFGTICNDTEYPEIKRYTVTDRNQIEILIHIFNGNLLLKKTTARFSKWVNAFNSLTGKHIPVISRWNPDFILSPEVNVSNSREKLTPETSEFLRSQSVIWNSSWLTGFVEAEAGFSAIQRLKRKTDREKSIDLRFLLDQTNELEILYHVRDVLGDTGSLWIRKKTHENIHYRYDVCHFDALHLLVKYFTRYPLRSKKNIVYVRWKTLLNYLELIKQERKAKTFVYSEKRHQRIQRLVLETKKACKIQQDVENEKKEVEERVQMSLKDDICS
jgi:hypothetical protein